MERGPTLGAGALHRLWCQAQTTLAVHGVDGNPTMRMGRRTRAFTRRQQRAIRLRDRGCSFPGCRNVRGCETHHCQQWGRDHGPTDVENGTLVCLAHHRLVHQHYWTVRIVEGGPVGFLPDATRWEAGRTPPVQCGDIVALRRADGGAGLAEHWDGTPLPAYAVATYIDHLRPAC